MELFSTQVLCPMTGVSFAWARTWESQFGAAVMALFSSAPSLVFCSLCTWSHSSRCSVVMSPRESEISSGMPFGMRGGATAVRRPSAARRSSCPATSARAARVLLVASGIEAQGPVRRSSPLGIVVAVPHICRRVQGLLYGRILVEWICQRSLRACSV